MEQYNVTGMTCAACQARVEKVVSKVPGVTSVSVSLLTNSMGVEGTALSADIVAAVEKAGYHASVKGAEKESSQGAEALADTETPKLLKRLIISLIFLMPLMYLSMGHMMWNWPLPGFLNNNHVGMGLAQLLFTVIIMVINQRFFISGFTSLIHRAPNMDTLVAMGATAAFSYSTYALFAMTVAQTAGNNKLVMSYMHEFYFESAAMILTLITLGKTLEAYSKGKTTDALKSLMNLAPKMATVVRNGQEQIISAEQVKKGDIFLVKPGESIPVDGIVLEGNSAIDEAALTGESIPVDKAEGDNVSAATINQSGFLKCEATRVGEDTTLSQIIKMVSDAAATKAPIAKIADKVSGIFVPAVITIAVITIIGWLLAGHGCESPGYCRSLRSSGLHLIKAFSISQSKDLATVSDYKGLCDYYLFDAKTSLYGGSGNQFDWNLLHRYSGMTPFLLSGGINPYSVKAIREFHHPKLAGIDINSRFETAPGNKDVERIGKFLQAIRTGETAG